MTGWTGMIFLCHALMQGASHSGSRKPGSFMDPRQPALRTIIQGRILFRFERDLS